MECFLHSLDYISHNALFNAVFNETSAEANQDKSDMFSTEKILQRC